MIVYPLTRREAWCVRWCSLVVAVVSAGVWLALAACSVLIGG